MTQMHGADHFAGAQPHVFQTSVDAMGMVFQIAGSSSQLIIDAARIATLAHDPDPSLAMAGQVGSQVKMRVGHVWLIASVRAMAMDRRDSNSIIVDIDFLGEGDEEKLTGRIYRFRRGVTRYPTPGTEVYPVSSQDMQQIYSADDRPHVQIGTVYPTSDTRAALYVDSMLGKHFALLGSTGTGKSTSAALILHRICDLSPQGHIVMIDPHGEYGAAFQTNGAVYDVNNLALPYWLMNFEEHCEVFVTSEGSERTVDCDILAKCLLAARSKNRLAESIGRLTVDSPVPYLLSDLTNILQNEMGKLDKGTGSLPYMRLKTKIDEIKSDPRYSFMFSGMLVADTMQEFIAKIFRLPSGASRSRSSTCRPCRPTSPPSWSRCCRGWCSTMPSGRGTSRNGRSCSFARKRIATSPAARPAAVRRCAASWSGSPRKAANMACRWALSPNARPIWPKACCRNAARSFRCASTTTATRPS